MTRDIGLAAVAISNIISPHITKKPADAFVDQSGPHTFHQLYSKYQKLKLITFLSFCRTKQKTKETKGNKICMTSYNKKKSY